MYCVVRFLSLGVLLFFLGCTENPHVQDSPSPERETEYVPVIKKRSDLNETIRLQPPRPIEDVGKIYHKGNYIFISQKGEGIHVINNENPSNPEKKGFIRIPGNLDMAIKGNVLYADNATDLLAIDLKNYQNVEVVKRIENVFPKNLPPDAQSIPERYQKKNRSDSTVIVKWVKRD